VEARERRTRDAAVVQNFLKIEFRAAAVVRKPGTQLDHIFAACVEVGRYAIDDFLNIFISYGRVLHANLIIIQPNIAALAKENTGPHAFTLLADEIHFGQLK
jgi:hypothetical protein